MNRSFLYKSILLLSIISACKKDDNNSGNTNNNNNSGGGGDNATHTCGAANVHNPNKTYGTMTDQEGNKYKTITIGTQTWMAENLRTVKYRNGEVITKVTDNAEWGNLTSGAWCNYENNILYECPYGKLYNWYAVADPRSLCPTGWHVPSDGELTTLINHLDPNADGGNNYLNTAGGKMKTTGTQYWQSPNTGGTNESGFSGLPGGYRRGDGTFSTIGLNNYWWSSSEDNTSFAWYRYLYSTGGNVSRNNGKVKLSGFSVRCLKD